jgi:hypothetical protein
VNISWLEVDDDSLAFFHQGSQRRVVYFNRAVVIRIVQAASLRPPYEL